MSVKVGNSNMAVFQRKHVVIDRLNVVFVIVYKTYVGQWKEWNLSQYQNHLRYILDIFKTNKNKTTTKDNRMSWRAELKFKI